MSLRPLDALLTAPEQRVIAACMMYPQRDYGMLELLAIAGSSRSAGTTLIKRWVDAGLLQDRRIGNQRRISVNTAFVLYDEIRRMVLKTVGLRQPLVEALSPLGDAISESFVFGSVAAGTDTTSSDIDMAIIGDVSLFDVSPLLDPVELALGRALHVNVYTPAEWSSTDDPIVNAIKSGPRIELTGPSVASPS